MAQPLVASGSQPFAAAVDLTSLECPTLLVRGHGPMHPSEVSDLYAGSIPNCTIMLASTTDIAETIGTLTIDAWASQPRRTRFAYR